MLVCIEADHKSNQVFKQLIFVDILYICVYIPMIFRVILHYEIMFQFANE